MKEYFEGKKLFGNDFTYQQILSWYNEEAEGYADLGSKDKDSYSYGYHMMNEIHGFSKVQKKQFENVLGFGSAWGYEFEPIAERIKKLTIIEPSDNLVNNHVGHLIPEYVKPEVSGKLSFESNSFDLITCFGTLHHIPNVSFVINELIRVLQPNGFLLLREPIVSMGDWRKPRKGLTKNERGIPLSFFKNELGKYSIEIISAEYCFTNTSTMQRLCNFLTRKAVYSFKSYVIFDKYLSKLLNRNVHYHATRTIHKIGPQSIFYVIRKISN